MTKGRLGKLAPMIRTLDTSVAKPLGLSPSYGNGRGGRPWRRKAEAIKLRDKYVCQMCGQLTTDGEVDHIVPLAKGGGDEDSNLQWLCAGKGKCHDLKTQADMRTP